MLESRSSLVTSKQGTALLEEMGTSQISSAAVCVISHLHMHRHIHIHKLPTTQPVVSQFSSDTEDFLFLAQAKKSNSAFRVLTLHSVMMLYTMLLCLQHIFLELNARRVFFPPLNTNRQVFNTSTVTENPILSDNGCKVILIRRNSQVDMGFFNKMEMWYSFKRQFQVFFTWVILLPLLMKSSHS